MNDKNNDNNNCQSLDAPSQLKRCKITKNLKKNSNKNDIIVSIRRSRSITHSSNEHKNADATNLKDPNDPNSGSNNNSDRTRNNQLQQKINTINIKLGTIERDWLTVKDKQHDRKLLSRVDTSNIASNTWITLPDLSSRNQAQCCIFYGRIVTTRGNTGSLLPNSENEKPQQDVRLMHVTLELKRVVK